MKRTLLFLGLICGSILLYWLTSQILSPSITVSAAQIGQNLSNTEQSPPNTSCAISKGYPNEIRYWCEFITSYAQQNNLDPNLIAALIWQESGGDPEIISRDGAVGLMQIMPRDGKAADFMCVNGPCFANRPSTTELKDPEFNIAWGTGFLSRLQQSKGNIRDALKAYGPANVDYYYADKVLAIYHSY